MWVINLLLSRQVDLHLALLDDRAGVRVWENLGCNADYPLFRYHDDLPFGIKLAFAAVLKPCLKPSGAFVGIRLLSPFQLKFVRQISRIRIRYDLNFDVGAHLTKLEF